MATRVLNQSRIPKIEQTDNLKNMEKSEIQNFFSGQTIFITGGTGFLGKVLIEKLLRVCYDLRKIYILVRVKKGKPEKERFKEIFDAACYGPLKEKYPNFMEKVELVNGDCSKPDVGLSASMKQMLMEEVTTIFHAAATVRFDQHLRTAAYINVRSVQDLLRMAKEMPQLRAFVYVSTAYSHCPRDEILEQFYEPPITGDNLLNVVNSLDEETIPKITPILLKDWPNGYVFTKAVAESVVEKESEGLPVAMVRPAIVTISKEEPVSGWVDNIYGVNGVVVGAALGILRTMPAGPDNCAELVPVDFVINLMMVAAWNIAIQKQKVDQSGSIPIYNYALSPWQRLTWSKFFKLTYEYGMDFPTTKAVWHFCFAMRPNPIHHEIALFFLHTIPSYLMDLILICLGKKPMAVEGYKKARKFLDVIAYFAKRDWTFGYKNVDKLFSSMSERDKTIFDFDLSKEDMTVLIRKGILGGRIYLLKEPLETLPEAEKWFFKLKVAHYVLCSFLLFLLYKFVMLIFSFMF